MTKKAKRDSRSRLVAMLLSAVFGATLIASTGCPVGPSGQSGESSVQAVTIQLVGSYLDQIDWKYEERFERNAISSKYSDGGLDFDVNIIFMDKQDVLYIVADNYIDVNEAVDEVHALLLLKKAMEENYNILVGKFE